MPATLIDTDPTNDVALLQINGASNLPTVSYGNSDNISDISDTFSDWHTYTVDWQPDQITWSVDGVVGRTKTRASTWNSTSQLYNYPQTPALDRRRI